MQYISYSDHPIVYYIFRFDTKFYITKNRIPKNQNFRNTTTGKWIVGPKPHWRKSNESCEWSSMYATVWAVRKNHIPSRVHGCIHTYSHIGQLVWLWLYWCQRADGGLWPHAFKWHNFQEFCFGILAPDWDFSHSEFWLADFSFPVYEFRSRSSRSSGAYYSGLNLLC